MLLLRVLDGAGGVPATGTYHLVPKTADLSDARPSNCQLPTGRRRHQPQHVHVVRFLLNWFVMTKQEPRDNVIVAHAVASSFKRRSGGQQPLRLESYVLSGTDVCALGKKRSARQTPHRDILSSNGIIRSSKTNAMKLATKGNA
jgi:hypothetical protein